MDGFAHLSYICCCGMGVSLTWQERRGRAHLALLHTSPTLFRGLDSQHVLPMVMEEAQESRWKCARPLSLGLELMHSF